MIHALKPVDAATATRHMTVVTYVPAYSRPFSARMRRMMAMTSPGAAGGCFRLFAAFARSASFRILRSGSQIPLSRRVAYA
jgi:hypothetical protein